VVVRSDQALDGESFPFISVGVVLSSALFIAIPSVVIFWQTSWSSVGFAGGVSGLGVSNDVFAAQLSRY